MENQTTILAEQNKEKSIDKINKKCAYCGTEIYENDKFCINCGKSLVASSNELQIIKEKINSLLGRNTVLSFIKKYSNILVFIFPVYLILTEISAFNNLTKIIDYIEVLLLYLFYICLVMLFANDKHICCILALAIRGSYSCIYLFIADELNSALHSFCRFSMVILLIYLIYIDYKTVKNKGRG